MRWWNSSCKNFFYFSIVNIVTSVDRWSSFLTNFDKHIYFQREFHRENDVVVINTNCQKHFSFNHFVNSSRSLKFNFAWHSKSLILRMCSIFKFDEFCWINCSYLFWIQSWILIRVFTREVSFQMFLWIFWIFY